MSEDMPNEVIPEVDKNTDSTSIKSFQIQLRNLLRKSSKQYKKYLDLMEESIGTVIDFSNVITQLTYDI